MNHDQVETEIKLRFPTAAAAVSALEGLHFTVSKPRVFEANMVYDTAELRLRSLDQLLRLRTCGTDSILTWKGPSAVESAHKSRQEVETGVSDSSSCHRILEELGYSPVFRYEKYRTEFQPPSGPGVATVDETPIGCFVELEGPPDWIDSTARELGFTHGDYITVSYATLYKTFCETHGQPVGWMVFPSV